VQTRVDGDAAGEWGVGTEVGGVDPGLEGGKMGRSDEVWAGKKRGNRQSVNPTINVDEKKASMFLRNKKSDRNKGEGRT
jgi:hypothetical protein